MRPEDEPTTTDALETEADADADADDSGRLSWLDRRHAARIARDAEQIALARLTEAREQLEQGLEAKVLATSGEAAQALEERLEKSKARFADLIGGARDTLKELRKQVSEAREERARLEQSGAETKAESAAVQKSLSDAMNDAIKELTTQADERVKSMTEGIQEATDLADNLRKEFSVRIDGAIKRLDRNSEDLDTRGSELKQSAETLEGRMNAAGERVASWEGAIRDQIDKAVSALKAEGDRQTERLDARIETLETQRVGLQQQAAQIQKESEAVRDGAVALDELVKVTNAEIAAGVGAAQRELDGKVEASRKLLEDAAAERDQEHEEWERTREKVADDLDRMTGEIREYFLVQLAAVRSRVEAIAEASGVARPPIAEGESSLSAWVPSSEVVDPSGNVNLNSAGITELRSLDLTMTQARRLLEHRERIGRFTSIDQIDDVPGITHDQRAGVKRRATLH